MSVFAHVISSKPPNILLPNLDCDESPWARVHAKRLVCYFQGQGHSKGSYDKNTSFYYIFWTADPFVTKLGFVIHYHKPEYFMKKLDCCVQDQGYSKICKCQWMFVQMISYDSLNLLHQSWCGDASLWARLSSKKIGLLSSRSRSQWRFKTYWIFMFLVSSVPLIPWQPN